MELMSSKMYSSPVCCVKQSPSSMVLSSLKGYGFCFIRALRNSNWDLSVKG